MDVAPHCHWLQVEDVVFILDSHRGEYFALTPSDTLLWHRIIAGQDCSDADHDAFHRLSQALRSRGWIGGSNSDWQAEPSLSNLPITTRRAFICLVRATLLVRWGGFAAAYRWARKSCAGLSQEAGLMRPALEAFSRAEHLTISRLRFDDCLPRSLALYVFLTGAGLQVRHCVGVRRYPFGAHAWVESNLEPLLAQLGSTEPFTRIATLGG